MTTSIVEMRLNQMIGYRLKPGGGVINLLATPNVREFGEPWSTLIILATSWLPGKGAISSRERFDRDYFLVEGESALYLLSEQTGQTVEAHRAYWHSKLWC